MIFIKLEEIIICKPLLSQVVRSILLMSCLFFEQNVPEGLLVATAENLDERQLRRR